MTEKDRKLDKDDLESYLGYEIDDFRVVPRFEKRMVLKGEQIIIDSDPYGEEIWDEKPVEENVLIAYDIQVIKKQNIGVIENKITICKTGDIINEQRCTI